MFAFLISVIPFLVWLTLFFTRGFFWLEEPQAFSEKQSAASPEVAVIVPARNEAEVIEQSLASLFAQDYPGAYRIFLVDDHSNDGTADRARAAAQKAGQEKRLSIISAPPLPAGWGGKLWAMQSGVAAAAKEMPGARYYLFTDADIAHSATSLRELVTRAEEGNLTLASFMVRLHCRSFAEKLLIPAFVFFFMMLYPFAWVRDVKNPTAAAAGGAMLVKRAALDEMQGFTEMKNAIIDDCTLANRLKAKGPIWLGLAKDTVSLRRYPKIEDIWNMVARTAYAQLNYSPLQLAVCVLGMALVFVGPLAALFCVGFPVALGFVTWLLMSFIYMPMLRFYGVFPFYGFALPFIALIYLLATLDSARRHAFGCGGEWKGRVHRRSDRIKTEAQSEPS